jgi:hypothetical protein
MPDRNRGCRVEGRLDPIDANLEYPGDYGTFALPAATWPRVARDTRTVTR